MKIMLQGFHNIITRISKMRLRHIQDKRFLALRFIVIRYTFEPHHNALGQIVINNIKHAG